MGKHRKWFWISGLYDNIRDIPLNGMILSGTHCTWVEDGGWRVTSGFLSFLFSVASML